MADESSKDSPGTFFYPHNNSSIKYECWFWDLPKFLALYSKLTSDTETWNVWLVIYLSFNFFFFLLFFFCTCVSRDVFHVPSLLIVGTTTAVVLINCNTWEPLYVLDFRGEWCSKFAWFIAKNNISSSRKSSSSHHVSFLEPVLSSSELENVQYTISTAGSFAFMKHKNNNVRFALLLLIIMIIIIIW